MEESVRKRLGREQHCRHLSLVGAGGEKAVDDKPFAQSLQGKGLVWTVTMETGIKAITQGQTKPAALSSRSWYICSTTLRYEMNVPHFFLNQDVNGTLG